MNITLASGFASEIEACAAAMIESGGNFGGLDAGMVVVRDDSTEYHERAKDDGHIFYSFEQEGVIFHVAFA